jgi:hypothetical protein
MDLQLAFKNPAIFSPQFNHQFNYKPPKAQKNKNK